MLFIGLEEKVPQTSFQTRSKQISHQNKQDERPSKEKGPKIERGAGDKVSKKTKQNKVIKENYGEQSDEFIEFIPTDDRELLESSTINAINESTTENPEYRCSNDIWNT